ncbi:MAG: leucine-rich repeat protein, partial [Bifidobacteriaceae bacterium]|nr:leucine-rich repeat protein [Bifidobacteriaceae bacterium]
MSHEGVDYRVTGIGDAAYVKQPRVGASPGGDGNLDGKNVTIPNTIETIGAGAFRFTGIKSLDLSDATWLQTIGNYAFKSLPNLTGTLTIPPSVTSIGTSAFAKTSFAAVAFSEPETTLTIGDTAFDDMSNLVVLELPTSDKVTAQADSSVPAYSFQNVPGLRAVVFRDTGSEDGAALARTLVGSGKLPSSDVLYYYPQGYNNTIGTALGNVPTIAYSGNERLIAAYDAPGMTSTIDSAAHTVKVGLSSTTVVTPLVWPVGRAVYPKSGQRVDLSVPRTYMVVSPDGTEFTKWSVIAGTGEFCADANGKANGSTGPFQYKVTSTSPPAVSLVKRTKCAKPIPSNVLTVPDTVTAGGESYKVTEIGENALTGTSLTGLDLTGATGLTRIGKQAFSGVSTLTGTLTIPSSVTSIDYKAFENTGFANVAFSSPATTLAIRDYAFTEMASLSGPLTIPSSVTSIGASAFEDDTNLTGPLTIPASVTSIGDSAFAKTGLTSLTLSKPATNLAIGNMAFFASSLGGTLTIPDGVTSIGSAAFGNTLLQAVRIDGAAAVRLKIGLMAFGGDGSVVGRESALRVVELPASDNVELTVDSSAGVSSFNSTGLEAVVFRDVGSTGGAGAAAAFAASTQPPAGSVSYYYPATIQAIGTAVAGKTSTRTARAYQPGEGLIAVYDVPGATTTLDHDARTVGLAGLTSKNVTPFIWPVGRSVAPASGTEVDLSAPRTYKVVSPDGSATTSWTVAEQTAPVLTGVSDQTVRSGQTATFTATVTGYPAPSLRWQESSDSGSTWKDLSEGGKYSGTTTATLSVGPVESGLNGKQYRLRATTVTATVESQAATLSVVTYALSV